MMLLLSKYYKPSQILVMVIEFLCLSLLSFGLYFAQSSKMSLSVDGFYLTYLQHLGYLTVPPSITIKEPGRPFVALAWNIGLNLFGGSVDSYNTLMFLCIFLSALFIYILLKIILPKPYRFFAVAVAALKLSWAANFEVFDNSGLAIYFCEMLFWLNVLILVFLGMKTFQNPYFRIIATTILLISNIIVLGTYQILWLFSLLSPLILCFFKIVRWKDKQLRKIIFLYYFSSAVALSIYYYLSKSYVESTFPGLLELCKRFILGVKGATIDTIYGLFDYSKIPVSFNGITILLVVSLLTLTGLVISLALEEKSSNNCNKPVKNHDHNIELKLVIIGLILLVVGILPTCIRYTPSYGNRLIHFASYGTIIWFCLPSVYLARKNVKFLRILSCIFLSILITLSVLMLHQINNYYTKNASIDRHFWESMTLTLPSVQEGTVVVVNKRPVGVSAVDYTATWIFRAFTGTSSSFFILDRQPLLTQDGKFIYVETVLKVDNPTATDNTYSSYLIPLKLIKAPRTDYMGQLKRYKIPSNKVVWLEWDDTQHKFMLVKEKSNLELILNHPRSSYSETLFPNLSSSSN